MQELEVFSKLHLENLPEEWVNSIWSDNFLTFSELPGEYVALLESDMDSILQEVCATIRQWLNSATNDSDSNVTWKTLKGANIDPRRLLAILGYVIKTGQQAEADEESRQSCLRATSLYLTLLSIPGSNIHAIFNPDLFHLALDTFILLEPLVPVYKKTNRNVNIEDLADVEEDSRIILSQHEKQTLAKGLYGIMYNLTVTLKSFYLKNHERSLEMLVHCLIEIAKIETSVNPLSIKWKSSKSCLASLSYNAYIALTILCHPNHGPVEVTICVILKYIFRHLLMGNMELSPKNSNILKETVLQFFGILLSSHKKEAHYGFKVLIQQIIMKCFERLEARQKQATIIAKMSNLFDWELYREIIEYLVLYSVNSKISVRIIVLEIIYKLLPETAFRDFPGQDNLLWVKRLCLAIVLSKCKDVSNMARGKAVSIMADFIEKDNQMFKEEFETIFNEHNNRSLPVLNDLTMALSENTNPLPGLNAILEMLNLRIEDDRALIRRSVLQIIKNVISFKPNTAKQMVPLIGNHCRDLSMVVRVFAIQMLTQMLYDSPDDDCLLEEWVKSAILQISDVETKVQDKVVEVMHQLILAELKIYAKSEDSGLSKLPWKIVDKIISMNRLKLLRKAYAIWVKNNNVNSTHVKVIRTHIGTSNETQAWVLLAIFSENYMLDNINIYFSNYTELITSNKYHVKFMLEVLKNCWSKIDKDLLQNIQREFYHNLRQFKIPFEFISTCIDILNCIYGYFETNGDTKPEVNFVTLMRFSEMKIDEIFNDEDSTIVCPLRVMRTLGKTASLCTEKVSDNVMNILQGILLDVESIPSKLRNYSTIRPVCVQLLGDLALRDRNVAEQITPILSSLMCQASEEQSTSEIEIRINAAKILADLCEKYTALVEPFLPDMCICMKDPDPRIREAIVIIFIQLLLEDFIKVKGLLFFHILTMISDHDTTIRELTISLIKERLIAKNKALMLHQFIRSIFHYNDCTALQKVSEMKMTEKEKSVLMLSGVANESNRRCIYDFMLEHVDPLGKVQLTKNLTLNVLNGYCDDTLTLSGENEICFLKDVIYVLSCNYIQPNFNTHKPTDDDIQEESISANVHNNVINCLMDTVKEFRIKKLMPILVKLQQKFKNSEPSVLACIDNYFTQLVLEYSKELFLSLIDEYPELENRIECIKKNKKRRLNEDNSDDEEGIDIQSNLEKKFKLRKVQVVLNRIETGEIGQKLRISDSVLMDVAGPSNSKNFQKSN